jgi:hypothetical protein
LIPSIVSLPLSILSAPAPAPASEVLSELQPILAYRSCTQAL